MEGLVIGEGRSEGGGEEDVAGCKDMLREKKCDGRFWGAKEEGSTYDGWISDRPGSRGSWREEA